MNENNPRKRVGENTGEKKRTKRTHHHYKNGAKGNTKLERNSLMGNQGSKAKIAILVNVFFYSPHFTSQIYSGLFPFPLFFFFLVFHLRLIILYIIVNFRLSISFYSNTCVLISVLQFQYFNIPSKRHRNAVASGSRCGSDKRVHRSRGGNRTAAEEHSSRRISISPCRPDTPAAATSDVRSSLKPAPEPCISGQIHRSR